MSKTIIAASAFVFGFGITAIAIGCTNPLYKNVAAPTVAHRDAAATVAVTQYCTYPDWHYDVDELNVYLKRQGELGWELVGTDHGLFCFRARTE